MAPAIDGIRSAITAVRETVQGTTTISGASYLRNENPEVGTGIDALYRASVTVAVCLEVLADAVAQTRLRLVNADNEEVDLPSLSFNLDEPALGMSQQMWLSLAVHDLKLTGNIFAYKPQATERGAYLVNPTIVRVEGPGRFEINCAAERNQRHAHPHLQAELGQPHSG